MTLHQRLSDRIQSSVDEFARHPSVAALLQGEAASGAALAFVRRVCRTHLKSPRIVAFLYALAAPASVEDWKHNLLEELGLEEADGESHPKMLEALLEGAGLGHEQAELQALAEEDLRKLIAEPLLYSTLKEVGLAVAVEVVAFEVMLSQLASRFAAGLQENLELSAPALTWFTHHAEADLAHAQQGLEALVAYAEHHAIPPDDADAIAEAALRENVFLKRYLGDEALSTHTEGVAV